MKQTRILILDDSLFTRELLHRELENDINIKVVAKASNAYEARDYIVKLRPDILITDIHMEEMSGIEFVKKLLPQYYLPVIMMSTDLSNKNVFKDINAVDFIPKPTDGGSVQMDLFFRKMLARIKTITSKDSCNIDLMSTFQSIIAIGASTGGAEAVECVLRPLPSVMPPIVVAQHMPPKFTKTFAERLNDICKLSVKEAVDGDLLIPGQVYLAPGGFHTIIKKRDRKYYIALEENITGMKACPCIDRLFDSVAASAGPDAVGVILTGMGKDGSSGLLNMRQEGAKTIGQDKNSSVIYGMPKVSFDIGAVEKQLPLDKIGNKLISIFTLNQKNSSF